MSTPAGDVIRELQALGIIELKKFQKLFKREHQLSLDLYATGNYDAMYLAGLIADDEKMTKDDLQRWAGEAYCTALSESTVAWVDAGGAIGKKRKAVKC